MFSQFKFVSGNANKVREAGEILGITIEQVEVRGMFEMQTQNIEELVNHKCQQAYDSLKCPVWWKTLVFYLMRGMVCRVPWSNGLSVLWVVKACLKCCSHLRTAVQQLFAVSQYTMGRIFARIRQKNQRIRVTPSRIRSHYSSQSRMGAIRAGTSFQHWCRAKRNASSQAGC